MAKIHYQEYQYLDVEYICILNDEGLDISVRLCSGLHPKVDSNQLTRDKGLVTCKRCLKKLM